MNYSETYNSDVLECPYCNHIYEIEGESYSYEEEIHECHACGKFFHGYQEFSVSHNSRPDCEINGIEHNYQPIKLSDNSTHDFCEVCEKCKPY